MTEGPTFQTFELPLALNPGYKKRFSLNYESSYVSIEVDADENAEEMTVTKEFRYDLELGDDEMKKLDTVLNDFIKESSQKIANDNGWNVQIV